MWVDGIFKARTPRQCQRCSVGGRFFSAGDWRRARRLRLRNTTGWKAGVWIAMPECLTYRTPKAQSSCPPRTSTQPFQLHNHENHEPPRLHCHRIGHIRPLDCGRTETRGRTPKNPRRRTTQAGGRRSACSAGRGAGNTGRGRPALSPWGTTKTRRSGPPRSPWRTTKTRGRPAGRTRR